MKTVSFICTIQIDMPDDQDVRKYVRETVELINLDLQRATLVSSPQIMSEGLVVTSIGDSEVNLMDNDFERDAVWSELRSDFSDEGFIHVDAWETEDDTEPGKTIAKINEQTGEVIYLDDRAKSDSNAQDVIMNIVWKIAK